MAIERTSVTETVSSQSSVQIESRAKGAPSFTIKVYEGCTEESLAELVRLACAQYDALTARYATSD